MDDFYGDEFTYYDRPEFRAYARRIEEIIHAVEQMPSTATAAETPGTITVRAIHEQLGADARREWTQDAIDSLKSIEQVGVLPTKYRRMIGVPRVVAKVPKNQSFKRIFPQHIEMDGLMEQSAVNAEAQA